MKKPNLSGQSSLAKLFYCIALLSMSLQSAAAGDLSKSSPTGSIFQGLFGLVVVLATIVFVAWLVKRIGPGANNNPAVVRIVGGVSVGNRERVVVVEVADRWIVVGVAPGQVNSLANVEIGTVSIPQGSSMQEHPSQAMHPFAKWLKQAINQSDRK
jgi:flagellar protein FliO/FliZ